MKYRFLYYPRCGTSNKAAKWLHEQGIEVEQRDIVLDRPSADELAAWIKKSGLPLRKFFNTSGQKYRELQIKDKIGSESDETLLSLLASDGMLVKRPLLVADDFVLVGFKEEEWRAKLL